MRWRLQFSLVDRRKIAFAFRRYLLIAGLLTCLWTHGRANVKIGVLGIDILYPPQSHEWIARFIQDEITHQLVISGAFAVASTETMLQWSRELADVSSRLTSRQLARMKLQLVIQGTFQKVLTQTAITWQLSSLEKNRVRHQKYKGVYSWSTPDQFFSSIFKDFSKLYPAFELLTYHPQGYTWESVESFYHLTLDSPPTPESTGWNNYKARLESFLSNHPAIAHQAYYYLARALVLEGSFTKPYKARFFNEAETAIKEALMLDPKNDQYRTLLALVHYLKGENYEAKAQVVIANAANSQNSLALIIYGLTIGNEPKEGESYIQRGVEYSPFLRNILTETNPYRVLLPKIRPWVSSESVELSQYDQWLNKGKLHFRQEEWKQAIRAFEKASSQKPGKVEAKIYLARIRIAQGDYSAALGLLKELQKQDPDNDQIVLYLGYIQEKLQYFSEAEIYYRKALTLTPENPRALLRLGTILIKMKKYEEALSFLESLTRKYPNYVTAWWNLGLLYWRIEDFEKAEQSWENALQLAPGNVKIMDYLKRLRQEKLKE